MDISGMASLRVDVQLQAGHWCDHKICYCLIIQVGGVQNFIVFEVSNIYVT